MGVISSSHFTFHKGNLNPSEVTWLTLGHLLKYQFGLGTDSEHRQI